MKIKLTIGGKQREFYSGITARKVRTAYTERAKVDAALADENHVFDDKEFDGLVQWAVESFDRQFTADEFLDGYEGSIFDVAGMMSSTFDAIVNASAEFPKPTAGVLKR